MAIVHCGLVRIRSVRSARPYPIAQIQHFENETKRRGGGTRELAASEYGAEIGKLGSKNTLCEFLFPRIDNDVDDVDDDDYGHLNTCGVACVACTAK